MASFGESFVDAYLAGKQMKRQREEDARKRKLEEELATVVRPGDIIGARGSAPAYDAEKFSTSAGVSIGDRPLSDFQPPASMANAALPAAGLAPPPAPSAQARAMRPVGLSPMSQLPPALAGEAGIVRPTVLAGGPPVGGMPVGGMPVAPLGHSAGAQPMPMDRPLPTAAASLPDPEKLVFYRDPSTGKGMAVEKGRERVATDADAAISAAAVYMANGDAQTATKMMRDAYALREASFKDEQITLQRALISAGVQNGGMTPAAITQFAAVYNDKIEDGVKLTPSVGPDGKLALGVGSENADTPMLWVNPVDGSMSRTPVYVTGAQAGSYLQTLITGNYAAYQADIVQAQTAAAAAARAEKQLANDTRRVDVAERAADFGERQWADQAAERQARVGLTRSNINQTDAATRIALADAGYDPEAGARQPAVGQMIYDRLSTIPGLRLGSAAPRSAAESAALPLSARDTYHRQGAAVDFTAPGQPPSAVIATVKAQMGPGYDVVYHPENGSYHVEPGPQWVAPGPTMRPKDIRAATARLSSIYAGALESTGDPASAMEVASRTAQTYGPAVARAWAEQNGILVAPPRATPTGPGGAPPPAAGALPYAGVAAELSRRGVGATPFSTVPRALRPVAPPPPPAVDPLEAARSAAFARYTRSN